MLHNLSADHLVCAGPPGPALSVEEPIVESLWFFHLVCAGPPGPALSVEEPKAFDNCDRPTRASAAVQGDRPGDRPMINAGARLREKYAVLRFSVQRRT